jgi:hypothetical protein
MVHWTISFAYGEPLLTVQPGTRDMTVLAGLRLDLTEKSAGIFHRHSVNVAV